MAAITHGRLSKREGTVYIMALMMLMVMSGLTTAIAYRTGLLARQATNEVKVLDARLAAESGISYALYVLRGCQSEPTFYDLPDMLTVVYDHLSDTLPDGTVTLVNADSRYISVAPMAVSETQNFNFDITVTATDPEGNLCSKFSRSGSYVKLDGQ